MFFLNKKKAHSITGIRRSSWLPLTNLCSWGGRGWGSFPFWLCACASGYLYLFQTPGVTPPLSVYVSRCEDRGEHGIGNGSFPRGCRASRARRRKIGILPRIALGRLAQLGRGLFPFVSLSSSFNYNFLDSVKNYPNRLFFGELFSFPIIHTHICRLMCGKRRIFQDALVNK